MPWTSVMLRGALKPLGRKLHISFDEESVRLEYSRGGFIGLREWFLRYTSFDLSRKIKHVISGSVPNGVLVECRRVWT